MPRRNGDLREPPRDARWEKALIRRAYFGRQRAEGVDSLEYGLWLTLETTRGKWLHYNLVVRLSRAYAAEHRRGAADVFLEVARTLYRGRVDAVEDLVGLTCDVCVNPQGHIYRFAVHSKESSTLEGFDDRVGR